MVVEMVVFGAASVLVGVFLLRRGTLPRWLPSGYVDQAGKRAELSQSVYRPLGVTLVLIGVAMALVAVSQQLATFVLAFILTASGLIYAIPPSLRAGREETERSLQRKRSMQVWSMLALFLALAINWLVFSSPRP
jgi:uncharacterized Tic20 family protein